MDATLLSLVAHDLKNELGGLESSLDVLARRLPEVQDAHARCVHLRQKLVAYLTVYAAQTQGLHPQVEDDAPADLLCSLARRSAPPDGVHMEVADGAPVLGFYDPRLVRLCLESALDNAMRFATSRVELGAQQQGEYLVFTVDDDGPGPLAEPTQAPTSTGLGLRLCTLVAQAHERDGRSGSARLLTRPSGGARFELRLP